MKNKRDLNFICAYADVYGMKNRPFIEVYNELVKFFNEGREATEGLSMKKSTRMSSLRSTTL